MLFMFQYFDGSNFYCIGDFAEPSEFLDSCKPFSHFDLPSRVRAAIDRHSFDRLK